MFDLFLYAAIAIGVLSLLASLVGSVALVRSLKRPTRGYIQRSITSQPESIRELNPRLQAELLSLVGGHRDTANRLVAQVQSSHPKRSLSWCFEKAIHDLERDRH